MAKMMQAYLLEKTGQIDRNSAPLVLKSVPIPTPGSGQICIRVSVCGVCHTELDEIEGRTPPATFPVIPGHQVVGEVIDKGDKVGFSCGDRVGVAWIYSACGTCSLCLSERENLCSEFLATGRDRDGGYAEYIVVPAAFAYPIPPAIGDVEAAPLLCAGAIGYRSLKLTGLADGEVLGLTGFGASGHIVLKLALGLFPSSKVLVFARSEAQQRFACELGAFWAGSTDEAPPLSPNAIIDTTPAWFPVLSSLKMLAPGGRLVINAIRKEDHDVEVLKGIDYPEHLWLEKEIKSVANITRADVREFLRLAERLNIRPQVTEYPFSQANQALRDLKFSRATGARVLVMG